MDELAIIRVSGVVLALMYLLRWAGVSPRWAPLLVPLLSVLGVGLWAYANGPISQPLAFSYLAGWVAVATSAATSRMTNGQNRSHDEPIGCESHG